MDLHPFRGSRNTPSRFILKKPEIHVGTDEPSWLRKLTRSLRSLVRFPILLNS